MTEYLRAGFGEQGQSNASRSARTLLTGGLKAARDEGQSHGRRRGFGRLIVGLFWQSLQTLHKPLQVEWSIVSEDISGGCTFLDMFSGFLEARTALARISPESSEISIDRGAGYCQ